MILQASSWCCVCIVCGTVEQIRSVITKQPQGWGQEEMFPQVWWAGAVELASSATCILWRLAGIFTFVSVLKNKDMCSVFGLSISSLCSPQYQIFVSKLWHSWLLSRIVQCLFWVGHARPSARPFRWHICPVTAFRKEVRQESTRKLQSKVMDPVAKVSSPAPPFLVHRGRSLEIHHGASFTCKSWRLHFRPPSGTVERGCSLGECSLIIIHMLWILNGRDQSPRDWWYWEGLSFLPGRMARPSDESHYSSASAAFMASEKIISR